MAYISPNYDNNPGQVVGDGECVSYVKAVTPGMPVTRLWVQGALVKDNTQIKPGTVIATFDATGHYSGHAAIFEAQTPTGLDVVDQYNYPSTPVHRRNIRFGGRGVVNDGDKFYVVE